jgi:hypothetical protein
MSIVNDISKFGRCGLRALDAAFRFSGIQHRLPSKINKTDDLRAFAKSLGLWVSPQEWSGKLGNEAVLAIYKVPDSDDYHAVFCSDVSPVIRYQIHTIITGWERLKWQKKP